MHPRIALATLPTPLVRAPGLQRALGGAEIWIKRDDLTGFGTAGNKARALEFLLGAARAEQADLLVAAGSPSSNFCAAAALAAATNGMACDLLFAGPDPGSSVNVALARAAGARLIFDAAPTREELDAAVLTHAAELRGRRVYAVPRGGATPTGALGYAHAAAELAEQCRGLDLAPATVVVATGSGGTLAGLLAGSVGLDWKVIGASVSRPVVEIAAAVLAIARGCAALLERPPPSLSDVDIRDLRGPGFGIAAPRDRDSADLALRYEGLLLDDYYGAKSMTLMRDLLHDGVPGPCVFVHTGGLSAALSAITRRTPATHGVAT